MQKKRITIKDVATMANVTPAVVSRLLNEDPSLTILESTKQRVYEAVKKTGYRPNQMARGLRKNKSGIIGLIIVDVTNPFNGMLIRNLQKAIERLGFICLIGEGAEDSHRIKSLVDFYLEKQVECLIICTALEEDPIIEYLERFDVKYILVTRDARNSTAPYVGFNNAHGMHEAMDHLFNLGHTRIAHIAGDILSEPGQARLRAYKNALEERKIPVKDEYIVYADWKAENANACMASLLALPEHPTAVIVCNDVVAIASLSTIYDHGLRVPEDISIIGFNNIQMSAFTAPTLTTIDTPTDVLGEKVSELFRVVFSKKGSERKHILIDTKLVIRKSTGVYNRD